MGKKVSCIEYHTVYRTNAVCLFLIPLIFFFWTLETSGKFKFSDDGFPGTIPGLNCLDSQKNIRANTTVHFIGLRNEVTKTVLLEKCTLKTFELIILASLVNNMLKHQRKPVENGGNEKMGNWTDDKGDKNWKKNYFLSDQRRDTCKRILHPCRHTKMFYVLVSRVLSTTKKQR